MIKITVKTDTPLGTWQGLGGAITEATAYNFAKLQPQKQQALLRAYFSKTGLDYRWGRISIGSNDFCLKPYEYTKKSNLSDFSIKHDQKWVIPMVQKILKQKNLKLLASPWSPPRCLKLSFPNHMNGILKPWQYGTYVKYLRRWLSAYSKAGIKINYITPQNEPRASQIWESCTFSFRAQRKLAYKYLPRALDGLDTQILLWDHNKKELEKVADKLIGNRSNDKIAGLCYHWYDGTFPDEMWRVRQKYPDIIMLSSEICCGFSPYNEKDWQNDANLYIKELFHDINTGATAFIDWNMLLDYHGGPNHANNYTKAPIILNQTGDDFILTPIYRTLKEFARYFPTGSKVIRCEYRSNDIVAIARKTKTNYHVVIANISSQDQIITLKLGPKKKDITVAKSTLKNIKF